MKKNEKKPGKRLVLSRETVKSLSSDELRRAAGGTCYSDPRFSQCCPAA
jgi:hypothetical protein